MSEKGTSKLNMWTKIFRANMLIGLSIAIFATYFIVTGTYENIGAREAAETTLGWVGVGGVLYLVGFFYMCLLKRHIFQASDSETE